MIFNLVFNFILGASIGSFLNVLIYRIPRKISISTGRSFCPNCGHKLSFFDLVPIISFIFLGGRCRYCKEKISIIYPIVEAITGLIFLLSFLFFGYSIYYLKFIIFSSVLIVISIIDLQTMEIPDEPLFFGLFFGVIFLLIEKNYFNTLIGLIIPPVIFFLIIVLSKGGMGGGDFKLSFLFGLYLGFPKIVPWFFLSFLLGFFPAIIMLLTKKATRKTPLPFGPFMALSGIITFLFGSQIIRFYNKLML
ncbi:MAG: prepilin peptidase [Caldisericia bacterium]|nr:prepilin peptidase [Caldisericia bacterium]